MDEDDERPAPGPLRRPATGRNDQADTYRGVQLAGNCTFVAAARSLVRAPSVRLEIGDSRCPTLPPSPHSKDLAARQNGTTVGAVAKSQKFFVTLEQDEDGWFVAKCPGLPGCVSQGKTREEAIANIREAIEGSLETRAANSIPSNIETIEIEILVA